MQEEEQSVDELLERPLWSSERTFVLSASAAAVGLGNLWRFPYMVGENGGAPFIVAYLAAVVFIGLPLMILEFALGRQSRGNTVGMFRYLNRKVSWFGWLVVGLTTLIMSYYLVITGWTLGYAVASFSGKLAPFQEFTDSYNSLWYFVITTLATGWIVAQGVSGIEKFAAWMMPGLVAMVVGLAAYGLTLPGRAEAIQFLFKLDFEPLRDPQLWFFAVGQAFYSLTVGSGYLITYGSSIGSGVPIGRSSVSIAGVETTMAFLAGFMIFPIVFTFGMTPNAGSELAFNSLPVAFSEMGIGFLIAPLFFVMFFAAALSSCVGGIRVISATIEEELSVPRQKAVYLTTAIVLLLGLPSALSFTRLGLSIAGRPFLEIMDMLAATRVLVGAGLITGTLIAWMCPSERLMSHLGVRSRRTAQFIVIVGRFVPLAVLLALTYTWFT
ncbi:MAG: sodium-dependent transporter [Bacillota bacterium]